MERRYSEDELIASVFAPIAGQAALGLADDAALLPPSSDDLVVTTDALVAGVHFFPDDPPGADCAQGVARKSLRSRGQGRRALGLPARAGAAQRLDQRLAARFRRRPGRRRGRVSVSAARRRHGCDAGAADHFHHGAGPRAAGALRRAARGAGGRRHLCDGDDRRRGARARAAAGGGREPEGSRSGRIGPRAFRLAPRQTGARLSAWPIPFAPAARRLGARPARSRQRRHGYIRRSGGRSDEA